ncbi:hypothetical protein LUD23_30515, partial [Klebsiella pneumoniae]|nr:hypothetical protein [Klebsiella pneumoniae]
DIALIQIQDPKNLTAIKLADSDALRVGDYTVAIGNPFGLGETGEVFYGRVPAGSVVVSGNLPSKDGKYSLYCAVIVKKVDA